MPVRGHRAHHDERAYMIVGTRKGAFVYESDFQREKWKRTGPYLHDHAIPSIAYDYRDLKTVFVASAGAGLHRTRDFGRTWEKVGSGLPGEELSHVSIGHLSEPGTVWVGLSGGRIARSKDGGATFQEVEAFHATPDGAGFPSGPGGAAVVSSIVVTGSPAHLHVAVSPGGVFHTEDAGATWRACNQGITPAGAGGRVDVHRLEYNPAKPERLFAVADAGIYRTDDAGVTWADVSRGLPSRVTRTIVVSPSKPGTLFLVPLKPGGEPPKVDGSMAVCRSIDGGESWEKLTTGLPERSSATVAREAMRMDTLDEEGLYVATSDGGIWVSLDEGEAFTQVVSGLTSVLALEVITEQE